MTARWARGLGALGGWRRYGLVFLLGALTTLAFAPFHLFPLVFIGFGGLALLLAGVTRLRAALALGWWFGWGHFIAGLYWIASAFLVEPEKFAWMVPFPVLGLPAVLAIFPALAVGIAWWLGPKGPFRPFALAGAWFFMELARGHVFTGFPWNLMGYVFGVDPVSMQPAAWLGAAGLSLFAVLGGAGAALLVTSGIERRVGLACVLAPFVLVAAAAWRLEPAQPGDGPVVRIVQPNIAQRDKWRRELLEHHFERQVAMSLGEPAAPRPDVVVWSETATTFYLSRDLEHRRALAELAARLGDGGGYVITGAPRFQAKGNEVVYYNAALAVAPDGSVPAVYDKVHLVPFGEYLPLRGLLSTLGLDRLAHGRGDFSPGPEGQVFAMPGLPPARILICYEAIFPSAAGEGERPEWLINLTNDGWFGKLTGPDQHFAMARFRAVEQGLPLVRAAGTGISAIVDAYGRIVVREGLGRQGVLTAPLPTSLPATSYSKAGAIPSVILAVLFLLPALRSRFFYQTRHE